MISLNRERDVVRMRAVFFGEEQCNCLSFQRIAETKRRFKDRLDEHRSPVDKTNIKTKPTTVSEHFLSHSDHSHIEMQLIPPEKIHSSRASVRKARESHDR